MKLFHTFGFVLFAAGLLHANSSLAQGLLVKYNDNYNVHPATDTRCIEFEDGHLSVLTDSTKVDYSRDQIQSISFYENAIEFNESQVWNITKSSAFLGVRINERANGKIGFQISTSPGLEKEVTNDILAEGDYGYVLLEKLESGTKYYFRPFLYFGNTRIYGDVDFFTTNNVCESTGHEYVDLGLPSGTLWAAYNVGSRNWSPGTHYYYGETEYRSYSSNYQELPLSNDVAHESWGGKWRMPTADEIYELVKNCSCQSASYGEYSGYIVTGRNGNSIFLPKSGFYYGSNRLMEYNVYLWSSTLYDNTAAYYLNIESSKMYRYTFQRRNEMYVRPVMSK